MKNTLIVTAFTALTLILFVFFCCDLSFPPASFEGPFDAPTPTPTFPPVLSPSPTPTIPPDGNMIYNADFDNGMDRWSQWINTGEGTNASIALDSGACLIDITDGRDTSWYIQLYQHSLTIVANKKYSLSFDARAASPRIIDIGIQENDRDNNGDGNNYTGYGWFVVNLSNTMTHYDGLECVMNEITDPAARLIFNFGADNNNVWLDNIMLVESDP
ncbi:MAG: carbohydrate binding domain-containing protein [Spirochaetales bacterium]|nr:carbohydrate binding domain-containing protein [Spirochaetales bacterium]